MERVMGIEPTSSAWEAEILPLNYTRYAGSRQDYHRLAYFDQACFANQSPILVPITLSDLYIGVFGLFCAKTFEIRPDADRIPAPEQTEMV